MPCLIKQLQPTLSNGFSQAMGFWRHRLLASAQGGRRGRREDVNRGRDHLDPNSMPTQYRVHFRCAVPGTVAENCDESRSRVVLTVADLRRVIGLRGQTESVSNGSDNRGLSGGHVIGIR